MRAVAGGEICEGYVGEKSKVLGKVDQKAGITIMWQTRQYRQLLKLGRLQSWTGSICSHADIWILTPISC